MNWRLSCLLLAALAMIQTYAAPLIADPTFSDIDLLAEDSQLNEVYVVAPTRTKRSPQFFGSNCPFTFGGCGGRNIFGNNNKPAYYQQNAYNNAFMYSTGTHASYSQQQQQHQRQPATVVNHVHHQHQSPLATVVSHKHQRNDAAPRVSRPQAAVVLNHEHRRNGVKPPPSPTAVAYNQQSSHIYPQSHYSSEEYKLGPMSPQRRPTSSHTGLDYYDYDTNDYSEDYQNYPAAHGFNGHGPFGFQPGPPFGGSHGHGRPGFGGQGPPGFGGHGPPDFGGRREPPGFNRDTPPAGPPPPPSQPVRSETASASTPPPTQQTLAPLPETTPPPVVVTLAPTTTSTTTSTTTEPNFDIDIRFGE